MKAICVFAFLRFNRGPLLYKFGSTRLAPAAQRLGKLYPEWSNTFYDNQSVNHVFVTVQPSLQHCFRLQLVQQSVSVYLVNMARNFMTAASSTAIPFFYDPVYYGYIPTNPPPDFSLPKPISDMTPQEKTQTKERFAKELRKALKEEEDNILKNFERPRDKFHRAMIIAEARGDEYLAEEIIRRGKLAPDNYDCSISPKNVQQGLVHYHKAQRSHGIRSDAKDL